MIKEGKAKRRKISMARSKDHWTPRPRRPDLHRQDLMVTGQALKGSSAYPGGLGADSRESHCSGLLARECTPFVLTTSHSGKC